MTRLIDHRVPFRYIRGFKAYGFRRLEDLLELVSDPAILVALNAEKVATGDGRVRRIVNDNIGYADGMGIVLALRRRGIRAERIAGSDLWLRLIESFAGKRRIYIVGSTGPIVGEAVRRLRGRFPDLDIVGYRDGYFSDDDVPSLRAELAAKHAELVFVAMGSPRQELTMQMLLEGWPALYVGLGGSLDTFVGQRRRAPRWMQRVGLEWLFRFIENPRRLARLPAYVRFAWILVRGSF